MSNPFEELKTAEDYNNFFLALVNDATDKGIEFNIYDPEFNVWDCWSYDDEEVFRNHVKFT